MPSVIDLTGSDGSGANPWSALTVELNDLQAAGRWLPGPATTLEVTGRYEYEADHERLLAWLLDPRAAHNLGSALLAALLGRAGVTDIPPPGLPT